jgi:uncharacterized damage-inducible protein DinB
MSADTRVQHIITPGDGFIPEIGRAVWMLQDARRRTLKLLEGLPEDVLDWTPPGSGNAVGSLLYHIAAIEMDWLFAEVMESRMPESVWADFPYPVRTADGRLTVVKGLPMAEHLRRLEATRQQLLHVYRNLTLEDFCHPRSLEQYDVTPEWVLHHLCQHEAEHRGEIGMVRALAAANGV